MGDVVLIRDKQAPRNDWPMGRVETVNCIEDGHVRSVDLTVAPLSGRKKRTKNRGISELVLLVPAPTPDGTKSCQDGPVTGGGVSKRRN